MRGVERTNRGGAEQSYFGRIGLYGTAGEGPGDRALRKDGRELKFYGYTARGAPFGPDDGTISPWAMLATVPFGRGPALNGTRHLLRHFPQVIRADRLCSGFNPTLEGDRGGWMSESLFGLDQGLLVMMIENERTGLLWTLSRGDPYICAGLARAGFVGGWL